MAPIELEITRMDESQMTRVLDEMGSTLDEVADHLRAAGVQGVRNTVRFLNPIVRYVQGHVQVDARSLNMIQGDRLRLTLGNGQKVEVTIPAPVRLFLDAFNRGVYPDLEMPTDDV
jgi:hypothetical protein